MPRVPVCDGRASAATMGRASVGRARTCGCMTAPAVSGCMTRPAVAVSRRAFLKGLAAAGTTMPLAGCKQADIGWLARMLVPPDTEAELGQQAFQQIMRDTPVLRDRRVQARVGEIGESIVRASNTPYAAWRFVVFDSEQANAFALPGGYVGVFSGMLRVTANDDQLSAVLGHEVGHVNARHGAERMVTEHFITLALRLLATLLALGDVQIPPELLVALGASAAELGIVRPFSRMQELEADALGLEYMADAGYDPGEAVAFWRRMQALTGEGGQPPHFLATHPSNERRIEELLERLPELESAAAAHGLRRALAALNL